MKKSLCLVLILSLLLATFVGFGLTVDAAGELPMLNIKCQLLTTATPTSAYTSVRLIASVDDLDKYSKVGWVFSLKDSTPTKNEINVNYKETTTVYRKILANGVEKSATDIYGNTSYAKYLFICEINDIPNANFGNNIYACAYVVLADGTIKYGKTSTINISNILSGAGTSSTVSIKYESNDSGWSSRWY